MTWFSSVTWHVRADLMMLGIRLVLQVLVYLLFFVLSTCH